MFHEVLFVLSGHPGNVFVPVPSTGNDLNAGTYAIADDFPLLHPTEREALNRLGHLGWMYHELNNFITKTQQSATITDGLYLQTFAMGLARILDDYKALLLSLEKRWVTKQDHVMVLPGGMVPLSFLTSALGRWELIIPSLLRIVKKLQYEQQKGEPNNPGILHLVMQQGNTGIPELHCALKYLSRLLCNVFFRHVTAWMMYGQLPLQPCDDFFITAKQPTDELDNNFTEWERHYTLHWERVPYDLLSKKAAESIFYVGKVVATLQTKRPDGGRWVLPQAMKLHHLDLLRSLQSKNPVSDSPTAPPSTLTDSSFSIIENSTTQITVPRETLLHHTDHVLYQIRRSITAWLFSKVFQQEHDLINYFSSFRQLFLLGDGEMAIRWLEGLDTLEKSCSYQEQHRDKRRHISTLQNDDLWQQQQREWHRTLVKASVGTQMEDHLDGYTFDFGDSATLENGSFLPLLANKSSEAVVGRLVYKLQWPIDLFLSHEDMQRYSDLWTLLMSLKKVQMALSRVFVSSLDQDKCEEDRRLWRLRSLMLFWVDTLWSHVQGNVINLYYDQLMAACHYPHTTNDNSVDFDEIQNAHNDYLINLNRGCLLSISSCRVTLIQLLNTCLSFCQLVKQSPSRLEMDTVSSLESKFTKQSDLLFSILSSQDQEMKLNGYLNELLMRLDYNKWYSTFRYKEMEDLAD